MESEEKVLRARFGKEQPFRVPDGYFDNLASDIMSKLPEDDKPLTVRVPLRRKLQRAAVAAACVCAVLFSTFAIMRTTTDSHQQPVAASTAAQTDTYSDYGTLDIAADYVMLDNEDIYAMVSSND